MRGDKPFAYDLVVQPGGVNSRVALLLRSIEPKPDVVRAWYLAPPFIILACSRVFKGGTHRCVCWQTFGTYLSGSMLLSRLLRLELWTSWKETDSACSIISPGRVDGEKLDRRCKDKHLVGHSEIINSVLNASWLLSKADGTQELTIYIYSLGDPLKLHWKGSLAGRGTWRDGWCWTSLGGQPTWTAEHQVVLPGYLTGSDKQGCLVMLWQVAYPVHLPAAT